MVSDAACQAVVDILRSAMPGLMACYLFGSAARGETSPDSDLDIAILLPAGEQIPDYLDLVARLSDAAGRQVDLVDLRKAGDFLRVEVLRDGLSLFKSDADQVLGWEAEAISEYGVHRARIRDILDDFQRTGVGYAL